MALEFPVLHLPDPARSPPAVPVYSQAHAVRGADTSDTRCVLAILNKGSGGSRGVLELAFDAAVVDAPLRNSERAGHAVRS